MSQKNAQIQQLFMKIDYTGDGKIEWVWIIQKFPFKSQTSYLVVHEQTICYMQSCIKDLKSTFALKDF